MFEFDVSKAKWFCRPEEFLITDGKVTITTLPGTDFWQRTYYGFRNDNAHLLYNTTEQKYFSLTARVSFEYKELFDQCGLAIYQDSDNWMKAGIELGENGRAWLGSVVTNNGYSDWATVVIDSDISSAWYRLSRRESDFLLESSCDGVSFNQMRIFHLFGGGGAVNFGLYACSPNQSRFDATFTDICMSDCVWAEHATL